MQRLHAPLVTRVAAVYAHFCFWVSIDYYFEWSINSIIQNIIWEKKYSVITKFSINRAMPLRRIPWKGNSRLTLKYFQGDLCSLD